MTWNPSSKAEEPESLVSPGTGVPKMTPLSVTGPPEEEEELVEAKPEEEKSGDDPVWSDKPTYADQLWRYPETCKFGPVITDVFILKKEEDRTRLNELMTRTIPEAAPDIVIHAPLPTQWSESEGSFVELVKYKKVHYKRLIKKQP